MPLYTDSSGIYWATGSGLTSGLTSGLSSGLTSSSRDQYSSYLPGAYVSYSRPLPSYSLPSSSSSSLRSNYTSSRYRPKLSTITESPYASRGLTPLTRINSPKVATSEPTTSTYYSTYTPARPINMNTADIDVSEKRFTRQSENYQLTPITPITETVESKSEADTDPQTDVNNNTDEQTGNEFGSSVNRSTIKRNRAVVRLSISHKQNPYITREQLMSPKRPKGENTNNSEVNSNESTNNKSEEASISWRKKVGEDLLKPIKTARKSPGDIMREKHFIPLADEKDENTTKIEIDPLKVEEFEVPDDWKPKEGEPSSLIVEVDPVTHTTVRRMSIPRCPDFQDFCEDISSDKLDDDLNAGALRRRASVIQEQEIELFNQLQKSASGSVQYIHLERVESASDLIPMTKRKSKKKRIRHKITATVDVQNPLPVAVTQADATLTPEDILISTAEDGSASESPKKSPKITYKVEDIQEDHPIHTVVKLPKKKKKEVQKTLETIKSETGLRNSPKKIKITKKIVPKQARNGIIEKMEEIAIEKPKEKTMSDASNQTKVQNAEQSEIVPAKVDKDEKKIFEKKGLKTPTTPLSPLKTAKPSEAKKSSPFDKNKTKEAPEYFKFDEESILKTQKLAESASKTKITTPASAPGDQLKNVDGVKLRAKPKPVKNIQKSDSCEDFWNTFGSRETMYFNKRKESLLESQWDQRETLLNNEDTKNVTNLDEIKSKVSNQKQEEMKEAAEYIDLSGNALNRRPRSNESILHDKNKGAKNVKLAMPTSPSLDQNTSKDKVITQQHSAEQQSKSNDLPKLSTGLAAKSPEIKNKLIENKKDDFAVSVQKSPENVANKTIKVAATPDTPTSPGLKKIANKKDCESDNKEKDNFSKTQTISKESDVKNIASSKQGKEIDDSKSTTTTTTSTVATENATALDAKRNLIKKSDSDINRKESEIRSSTQISESVASPTTSKQKLTTLSAEQKLKSENAIASKESGDKESLSQISKNLPKQKSEDAEKIKAETQTTITKIKSDDDLKTGKKFATDDVKIQNKTTKTNAETASDAKIKNKTNATATTKTCDDKTTKEAAVVAKKPSNDAAKISSAATTTTTATSSDASSSSPTTSNLAKNIPTDKSIEISGGGGSNNNNKTNLVNSSNINSKELGKKNIATKQSEPVGQRASQQLSYKRVLQKNKEQNLEEYKKEGNLQKFDTVSNLNEFLFDVDADLKDISPEKDNSDSDYSGSDSMKRKDKKLQKTAEPEPFNRQRVKLDHTKKVFVKEEPLKKYQLIATPRPLWKPENVPKYSSDSGSDSEDDDDDDDDETTDTDDDSECETSSGNDESAGEEDELNPHQKSCGLIRMSTCSNDSGFVGGTAPTNPKKMLGPHDARDSPSTPPSHNPAFKIESNHDPDDETSYTYAQFQKTGRITAPATNIPRFKKYAVEDFHFLAVLGKGSFGKVLLAELRNSDYYYAVKCLKKDVVLEDDDVECTLIERKVLALGTKHPYLCHLFCTFQTESHLFFVMEYLNGGDLMFHIQQSGRFPEPRARFYAAEIVSGLKFLHKKGIIYRDLKLDNVLLDFEGHVRIADFGMCKLQIYLDKTADSFCGTPDYMAPEIIKGDNYNQNVDWWSFGVLLYEMLIGQSPFSGCDEEYLFWSICNEMPMYPMCLSQEATSLLKALLEKDSAKRIGSQYSPQGDILVHPFFAAIDWDLLEKRQIEPPFKPQVKHPLDTKYFDKTFTRERVRLTPIDKEILHSMDQAQFQGFSYTNPNATLD